MDTYLHEIREYIIESCGVVGILTGYDGGFKLVEQRNALSDGPKKFLMEHHVVATLCHTTLRDKKVKRNHWTVRERCMHKVECLNQMK